MLTVVATLHVIVCIFIICLVLLQDPKNSGAGGVFGGGGTGSLLGATGAVTFLTRLTRYTAILFGITCLVLSLLSRPNTGSVIDSMTIPASAPAPVGGVNGAVPPVKTTSPAVPSTDAPGTAGAPGTTGSATAPSGGAQPAK
jgi:preprotein translocase subunit SecG